jgi:hypothetical protein
MCRAYFFTDDDEPGGLMGLVRCDRPCAAAKMIYVGPEHVTAVFEQLHAGLIPDDLPVLLRETLHVPADCGIDL